MRAKHIITDFADLAEVVKTYRNKGKKIVLTQGSFDMVHVGHARYCELAKSYGDVLFVGVDSDEKIRQRKGPDRPVVPQEERLEILTYLRSVDEVVLKEADAPKFALIKAMRPDVLIATEETYSPEKLKEVSQYCGKVVVLERQATASTSAKLRRVQMGAAKKISAELSAKLMKTIEDAMNELKQDLI